MGYILPYFTHADNVTRNKLLSTCDIIPYRKLQPKWSLARAPATSSMTQRTYSFVKYWICTRKQKLDRHNVITCNNGFLSVGRGSALFLFNFIVRRAITTKLWWSPGVNNRFVTVSMTCRCRLDDRKSLEVITASTDR